MSDKISVLIVDDETDFRESLASELQRKNFDVKSAENSHNGIKLLSQFDFDVALIDIRMPKIDGIEFVKRTKKISPDIEAIMLTGFGTLDNAIKAMKAGASDFLRKPCPLSEVEIAINKAYDKKIITQENRLLKNQLNRKEKYPELIGKSQKLKKVLSIIDKVAPLDSTVLILGESGVGKELVARSIHRNSSRAAQPFIVLDCCSLNETLMQSELFGHEKGAFTGATSLKHGLFEVADGGTLFIDEIGEVNASVQAGLLRILETGCYRRLGGVKDLKINVRILTATNRNLTQAIKDGQFREDLFYRLNVVSVMIPPLRERTEDIPLLIDYAFKTSRVPGARNKKIAQKALNILMEYQWPGNIRELINLIECAIILSENENIQPGDLPLLQSSQTNLFEGVKNDLSLSEIETAYIEWIMRKTSCNQKRAAEILKIDPKTLYRKLKIKQK
ncbi:sigma-54-dependent Fis family transcriptional regulator [candidate division KSB1 bacterium]|nr:sigma-54-dependent Fis family transcriptional regulator [candidate division KSB1 bacterium]